VCDGEPISWSYVSEWKFVQDEADTLRTYWRESAVVYQRALTLLVWVLFVSFEAL
jgi:hypothetical protein